MISFSRRRGNTGRRHVEEDEVVVVGEAHHQARRAQRRVVEKLAHRGGGRLEHRVELLPPVDLFDLRVANEVEIQHDQLAALLEQRARPLDHHRQRRQAGERVVEHLLVLDALDAIRDAPPRAAVRARRRRECAARSRRRRSGHRYHSSTLSSTARRRTVSSAHADDDRNSARVRALDDLAQHARIGRTQRARREHPACDTTARGQLRRADALDAPPVELLRPLDQLPADLNR